MKILKNLIVLTLVLSTINTIACDIHGKEGFFTRRTASILGWKSKAQENTNHMTQQEFSDVLDKIAEVYNPIFADLELAPLKVIKAWDDKTVNAFARPVFKPGKKAKGNTIENENDVAFREIKMFGGLARHAEATVDGLAMVACHEIGHHIGGYPRYTTGWASNEGQSDYFASSKCFRKVFENDDNQAIIEEMSVPFQVMWACEDTHGVMTQDFSLCVRSSMAGLALARLLGSRGKTMPTFKESSENIVKKTNDKHPAAQCRLDTYFAGAICQVDHTEDIPSNSKYLGTCQAMQTGARPACWFAANN